MLMLGFGMFVIMLYGESMLLDSTVLMFKDVLLRQTENFQIIYDFSFDRSGDLGEIADFLVSQDNVSQVLPCDIVNAHLNTLLVRANLEVGYLVSKDNVQAIMDHIGAFMVKGDMPSEDKEIVIDELYSANQDLGIGDTLGITEYDRYKIVGILKSDCYLMTGVSDAAADSRCVVVLSSSKGASIKQLLDSSGYDTGALVIVDNVTRGEDIDRHVIMVESFSGIVIIASTVVIVICLLVMANMYLKDRRAEWCYYYSIGYSRSDIYLSVIKELLLTILGSVFLGAIGATVVYALVKNLILLPAGINPVFVLPEKGLRSIISMWFVFALIQPMIYFNMQKIDTIDLVEKEELV